MDLSSRWALGFARGAVGSAFLYLCVAVLSADVGRATVAKIVTRIEVIAPHRGAKNQADFSFLLWMCFVI